MWVDSGQFFFHYWCITDERGKSEVSESYLAVIRKDRLGDTSLPMVSVPRRGFEGEKNRKKPKTSKCCYVRINSRNIFCDQYGCFCRRRLVYLPSYLPSFKWVRSTLEGWKISACSHLLFSSVFHIQLKQMQLCNFIYTCTQLNRLNC